MPRLIKLTSLILTLFFCATSPSYALSNVEISNWKEDTTLTKYGKITKSLISGKLSNLGTTQVMTAFSISYDIRRHIKIKQVAIDNVITKFSFRNNILNIKFPKFKRNNDPLSIYIKYEENYDKISQYLRQEIISIPAFAAGANAHVAIKFPGFLESATLNPNLYKSGNYFIYNNIVPNTGVHEIIKLTPAHNSWDIAIKVKVDSNKSLKKVNVTLPNYFENGGQKVQNIVSKSTITPKDWNKNHKGREFEFSTEKKSLTIHSNATISTGQKNKTTINRNPNHYLFYSKEDESLLRPILDNIKRNAKYSALPLYAQIGDFVHNFIKYDSRYIGKLLGIREILTTKTGVCTEYASMFTTLARMAKIPALTVNGAACGEYSKCQGHAWNMIYYKEKWIQIDPTWDLMSGRVSSSHVYFSDDKEGAVGIKYYGSKDMKVSSKMDFDMTNIQ